MSLCNEIDDDTLLTYIDDISEYTGNNGIFYSRVRNYLQANVSMQTTECIFHNPSVDRALPYVPSIALPTCLQDISRRRQIFPNYTAASPVSIDAKLVQYLFPSAD